MKGQLQGIDSSGTSVEVSYDGDVVLDINFPYRVTLGKSPDDESWPDRARWPSEIENLILQLRFSLMLAVTRESHVQLIPTWRVIEDPFNLARAASWSDPKQGPGFAPTQLTEEEVKNWQIWFDRILLVKPSHLSLAITRIIRAISERREPSDVLIDAVIAWESLFGTKEGEPTFRVTTCLAKLLAITYEERRTLRTRLGKIYSLRSKIVHGGGVVQESEYPMCQEALSVAVQAVRALIAEQPHLLDLPDGAERSAALLLS